VPPTGPISHRVDAGVVHLTVHDWGGEGGPVLLAHATGFHGRCWAPVAERLAKAGRRVWSFDFRGHGDSDPSPDGYNWEGFGRDVLAIVDHLGLAGEPAVLPAGHSKGAAALLLAEEARPGTFPRLWCYEPILFPSDEPMPPQDDFFLAEGARRRREVWDSREEALAAYGSKPPLDVLDVGALHAYVEHGLRERADGTFELKCRPDDEAAIYSMGMAHGAFGRLGEVQCPTVIACGELTDAIGPELAEMIAARMPRGRHEVLAGLGHFGPMQDPDAVVGSMLTFATATVR
jgi:pimeloyl-ACP methyl ester carboxylesterase